MIIYFGIKMTGFDISPVMAGILVTLLNTCAYMAETVRAGIKFIDVGQREGALAMGMSPVSTMIFIILPRSRKYISRNEKFVSDDKLFEYQKQIITNLADTESCVIVGKCADYILRGSHKGIP